MIVRHTLAPGDGAALAELLAGLGWGEHDGAERAQALLHGATWFALAEAEGGLVGYARALSDGVAVTYLAELGVAVAHRRRGVGSALLGALVAEFGHTAIYADAAPAAVALLARHGIRAKPRHLVACARGPTARPTPAEATRTASARPPARTDACSTSAGAPP